MIDKEKLKRRFSRNARNYDRYAAVQKLTAQRLMDDIKADGDHYREILEIGCGTGYLTNLLAKEYPLAKITAVDIADGMIEYANSRLDHGNISFICADAEEMPLTKSYDLIVSNATFQWFNHLETTLAKLTSHLREGGKLKFSTFGQETFKELHQAFSYAKADLGIQSDIAPGQSFISREALHGICQASANHADQSQPAVDPIATSAAEFTVTSYETFEREYFPTCLDFLASVKKIGANKSQTESAPVPGLIEAVMGIYDREFREETLDQIYATYHCLYFNLTDNRGV